MEAGWSDCLTWARVLRAKSSEVRGIHRQQKAAKEGREMSNPPTVWLHWPRHWEGKAHRRIQIMLQKKCKSYSRRILLSSQMVQRHGLGRGRFIGMGLIRRKSRQAGRWAGTVAASFSAARGESASWWDNFLPLHRIEGLT